MLEIKIVHYLKGFLEFLSYHSNL